MARDALPVLTFHSISMEPGPTSIAPDGFRRQMEVLAECGYSSITCEELLRWHRGEVLPAPKPVLITFDDAFADFATAAQPALCEHGFSALVFVPTGFVGRREGWRGANASPRPLLDWPTIAELAQRGVEFGGHGVKHTDLTALAPAQRRAEIAQCAEAIAEHTGRRPRSFAAPYGHVDAGVIADIAAVYDVAFGTRLDRTTPSAKLHDLPRIEMHYFRDMRRWRAFLEGGEAYFLARRALRAVRESGERLLKPRA